jgi:hypothetical protein
MASMQLDMFETFVPTAALDDYKWCPLAEYIAAPKCDARTTDVGVRVDAMDEDTDADADAVPEPGWGVRIHVSKYTGEKCYEHYRLGDEDSDGYNGDSDDEC